MADHIYIPGPLATVVEAAGCEAETACNPPLSIRTPDSLIHIPKRRSSKSGATANQSISISSGSRRGQGSSVSADEAGRRTSAVYEHPSITESTPVVKRLSMRLSWRNHITPAQLEEGRTPPGNPQSRSSSQPFSGTGGPRSTSLASHYNMASLVNIKHKRKFWIRIMLEFGAYIILVAFVYFVLVGVPLWKGAVYWLYWLVKHKFVMKGGWSIVMVLVVLFSYTPLLAPFEKSPPGPEFYSQRNIQLSSTPTCALIIPAYRSGAFIGHTLDAALKIFPASHVFVVANGNSSSPLDSTEEICRVRGVNHIWCPIGSKIIAIFVGCHAAKGFRHILLMDDDCILPLDFPVVTSRLTNGTQCISYTIKCTGADSSQLTWCQKAQDLEYKLAGLQRSFAGRVGSATFPHGAISLWDKGFLKKTMENHPGFSISEDWFMGHACRRLGGRIKMCSAVFVETGTPSALFWTSSAHTRGGFGETTLFKQRFLRWNFFVFSSLWHNMAYIAASWRLGWWEFGTKIFVVQEVYETMTYLLAPFILPISILVKPGFCMAILAAIVGLYLLQAIIFNEIHLRRKKEHVSWAIIIGYYIPFKICLSLINVVGSYWCLFKYARYFAQQRLKLTEDHKVVGMVLKLEQQMQGPTLSRKITLGRVDMVNPATRHPR